jgi:hypothetical protein
MRLVIGISLSEELSLKAFTQYLNELKACKRPNDWRYRLVGGT